MKSVKIFDPALCCPTGVCGPSVDPELTRVASVVFSLSHKGFDVTRYNLANEPAAFVENEVVSEVLQKQGPDALPMVLVDGEVVKTGEYPSNEEFANWLGVSVEQLKEKPKVKLPIDLKKL